MPSWTIPDDISHGRTHAKGRVFHRFNFRSHGVVGVVDNSFAFAGSRRTDQGTRVYGNFLRITVVGV